jgi:hypothetical protein
MKTPVMPTPELRRKAEWDTIFSACTGALGDVTLTDSAVIILFAAMMGAGDMFSMLTTAIMPFMGGVLLIPMAYLATKVGIHRLVVCSCAISAVCYFLIVATPFFGSWGVPVMMIFFTSAAGIERLLYAPSIKRKRSCFLWVTMTTMVSSTNLDKTVAIAAPATPSSGNPSLP